MYELLYIVSPAFTDPQIKEVMHKVEALVTSEGGEVNKHSVLTKQPLAYTIKKQKHGTYVLMHLTLPPSALLKVERILRLEMGVEILRHLVTCVTEVEAQAAFELLPYVYPLSERERPSSPRPRAPKRELPPPAVAAPKMSVEELDKKLDEILKDDTLDTI